MNNVTLVMVPGSGASTVSVADDTTVASFIADNQLSGRQIIIDGRGIPTSEYDTTTLNGVTEVFATGAVKGN